MQQYTVRAADIGSAIAEHSIEGQYGYTRAESLCPITGGWARGQHLVISTGFAWHGNTGGQRTEAYLVPTELVASVQAAIEAHDLAEAGDLLCRAAAPPTLLHIAD